MAKKDKTTERFKNKKDDKPDLIGNGLFKGEIPGVVGRTMLLVRDQNGKSAYIYVTGAKAIQNVKDRYGKDFVREIGILKVYPKPCTSNR